MHQRTQAALAALSSAAASILMNDTRRADPLDDHMGLAKLHTDDDALSGGGGTSDKPAGDESTVNDVKIIGDDSPGTAQQTQQAGSVGQQGDGTGTDTGALNETAETKAAVGDPPAGTGELQA